MTKLEDEKRLNQLGLFIYEVEEELTDLRKETRKNQMWLNDCLLERKQIDDRLNNPPSISDYALLQYVKLRSGVDVEKFRKEIMSEGVIQKIDDGAVSVKANGCKLMVQDKTIVEIKT